MPDRANVFTAGTTPVELQDASETVKGIVELATTTEATTGTDTTRAVTPAGVAAATLAAAIPKTLADAKGDLLVGSANDTVTRLPVGADGSILVADSNAATGLGYQNPMRRIGRGSPYSVITPSGAGETWTDLDQTRGARVWTSTGTTTTSWVVTDGDTGWRKIADSELLNGWTTDPAVALSGLRVRRVNSIVDVAGRLYRGTDAHIYTMPIGLGYTALPTYGSAWYTYADSPASGDVFECRGFTLRVYGASTALHFCSIKYPTVETWPTVLPGTAA